MSFDKILIIVMAIFSCIGGLDRIFGNRLGIGNVFEKGILTIGQLALSMIGIMVLAPIIAELFDPVFSLYRLMGFDPAVLAGSLLACDMGGAQLASSLTADVDMAQFGGIVVSSMLGVTVSFTIPVAMQAVSETDRTYVSKGILCGIVTVPIGCFVGGMVAGLPLKAVLFNCMPILLLALLIAAGLWKAERHLIKGFQVFGKLLIAVAMIGLVAAGVELTTDFVMIQGLGSIEEAFVTVGEIAIVLSGALPLMSLITKLLNSLLTKIGRFMNINTVSVSGLLSTLANSIVTFDSIKDMDDRGKILNMAFAVSGAFILGDHLAFAAGYAPEVIPAMLVGKFTAAVTSVCIALIVSKEKKHV